MINFKKVIAVGTIMAIPFILAGCKLYKTPSTQTTQTEQTQPAVGTPTTLGEFLIVYSGSGFTPGTARVKVGQRVEFSNASQGNVQVNSAVHPTHELFPELNIGMIAPNETKAVTFTKAGTYKYHNHLDASQTGEIVVE